MMVDQTPPPASSLAADAAQQHETLRARHVEYERRKASITPWKAYSTPEQWEAACRRIAAELGL